LTFATPAIGDIRQDDVASTISRNTGAGGETQNPAFVAYQTPAVVTDDSQRASQKTVAGGALQVRRLLPVECEKLQGFPPGYTDVPYRGKPAADGPRYKALGNSMAINVMRWIGERIEKVDKILK
jgi:DNA (cytosine-5)-methyltransferase 1